MENIKKTISDYIGMLALRTEDVEDSLIHGMEKRGVYIGDGYYAIMLFSPYKLSDRVLKDDDDASFDKLQKLIDREFYEKELYYQTLLGGHCVCLICYPHAKCDSEAELNIAALRQSAANIQEAYAAGAQRVTVIISSAAGELTKLRQLFRMCLESYDYFKFIEKIPDIYTTSTDKAHGPALSQFQDMKTITQLAHRFAIALRSGKTNEFQFLLPQIYDAILTPDAKSLRMLHYRMFSFLNQLLLSLNEMDIVNHSFLLNHAIFQQMTGAETESRMKALFQQFVQDLHSESLKKRNRRAPLKCQQAENVKKYIDSNLTDAAMDVCQLSRIFEISQPLLSSSFKRSFECSPSDYIRQKRIELVKTYLNQTEKSLMEICLLTGFASLSTMQRSFRLSVGMTPGCFRMQCRLALTK